MKRGSNRFFCLALFVSFATGVYAMEHEVSQHEKRLKRDQVRIILDIIKNENYEKIDQGIRSGCIDSDIAEVVFFCGVCKSKVDFVRFFLERFARDLVSRQFSDGITALHVAAQGGDLSMAKLLLEHGADCTVQDNKGKIPLIYAVYEKVFVPSVLPNRGGFFFGRSCLSQRPSRTQIEIAKYLLDACDHTLKDNDGKNAHFYAQDEKLKALLANPDKYMQEHPQEFDEMRQWQREIFQRKTKLSEKNIFLTLRSRELGSR